ncbi:MAG: hypothetical protein QG597_1811, partial [Actinomycetota bacterium]|nr:hypothetical protein [Actinomycetota bacterium]
SVAVAYNLTVPNPAAYGHLRVEPGDAPTLTSASAVNFMARQTIANGLTTKISPTRTIKLYNGATGPADAIVDIVGYFVPAASATPGQVAGGRFTPTTPTRVYSSTPGGAAPTGVDQTTTVDLSAVLPTGASAVAYNITVVAPTAPGHLRVYPAGQARPATSTINFITGDRVANGTAVQVSPDRKINVYNGSTAPVSFIIDVVGYYSATGAFFHAIDPVRTMSTRPNDNGPGPIDPDSQRTVDIWHTQATPQTEVVPVGATAIDYNVTVVAAGTMGHLRVWPADQTKPGASTLNWPAPGYTRANGTTVGISPTRHVNIYNSAGTPTNVLIDINGYYIP